MSTEEQTKQRPKSKEDRKNQRMLKREERKLLRVDSPFLQYSSISFPGLLAVLTFLKVATGASWLIWVVGILGAIGILIADVILASPPKDTKVWWYIQRGIVASINTIILIVSVTLNTGNVS